MFRDINVSYKASRFDGLLCDLDETEDKVHVMFYYSEYDDFREVDFKMFFTSNEAG